MDARARTLLRLLVIQTVIMIGGPFGIGAILKGGESPDWPPDRPVEWLVVGSICGVFGLILVMILSLGLKAKAEIKATAKPQTPAGGDRPA